VGMGTIDSHLADGEYDVQLKYNRAAFDEKLAALEVKIAAYEERITEIEDAIEYGQERHADI